MEEELRRLDSTRPDVRDISEDEMERLVGAMMKTLEFGIGAVYGLEEDGVFDAEVDCTSRREQCKSACCTFLFALTKDEVQKGTIRHDTKRPFFIARDDDGYCAHRERGTLRCSVWNERPLKCRRYDCSQNTEIWRGRENNP